MGMGNGLVLKSSNAGWRRVGILKRLNADVRQFIDDRRRQHSRKPDGIHERIERLVAGPYLELFARQQRPGWTAWGNEINKFDPVADVWKGTREAYEIIRERKAAGGPGWRCTVSNKETST